jgi:hypothetical protein
MPAVNRWTSLGKVSRSSLNGENSALIPYTERAFPTSSHSKHKMIGWSTWEGYRDLFEVCKARKAIPLADYEYTYHVPQ